MATERSVASTKNVRSKDVTAPSMSGVVRDGRIDLDTPPPWPSGTRVLVSQVTSPGKRLKAAGHAIIVGFGLAGRCVADLLSQTAMTFTIVERNAVTVEMQRALGRETLEGDATDPDTLIRAGLNRASILALTIPDENAVIQSIVVARRLRPDIYIIARTRYASKGMKAKQLGADDVVKAEQAVALKFYEKLANRIAT